MVTMKHKYLKRVIDDILEERLEMIGAIVIEGPNGVGKQQQVNNMQKVS